jgi:hypothetical protein
MIFPPDDEIRQILIDRFDVRKESVGIVVGISASVQLMRGGQAGKSRADHDHATSDGVSEVAKPLVHEQAGRSRDRGLEELAPRQALAARSGGCLAHDVATSCRPTAPPIRIVVS